VVTGMSSANTGLSPEWDRWFDEAFTDLIAHDEDLVQQEFDALIGASWHQESPPPPAPPAPLNAIPSNAESTEGRSQHHHGAGPGTGSGELSPPE
jgi:hypothetical protein